MRVSINIIAQFISCMMISGIAFADSGIMSKYGTIQGVDGYSTNPFWSSNTSTYSNRMPVPVYENGPDVQTDECLKIVSNFVSAQCNALNNCADTSLSDIRPAIILQLSRMSGGNYATSCSGYLDEIFRQYKQAHQTPGASATFPTPSTTAKAATTNTNKSAVPLNNFFDAQKPAWAIEMQERTTELAEFQADNEKFYPELVPMDFPKTYADLSFGERMANNKAGYEPYQGKSAFKPIQVEDLDKYEKRQEEIAKAKQDRDKARMKIEDFCKKYPKDATCVQRQADQDARKAVEDAEKEAKKQLCKDLIKKIESLEQRVASCEDENEKTKLTAELDIIKTKLTQCNDIDTTEIEEEITNLEQGIEQKCKPCPVFEPKYFTVEGKTPTPYQVQKGGTTWDFHGHKVSSKYKPRLDAYWETFNEYQNNKTNKQVCNTLVEKLNNFNTEFKEINAIMKKFINTDNKLFLKGLDKEQGHLMTPDRIQQMFSEYDDSICSYNSDTDNLISTKDPDDAITCAQNYVHYLTKGYIDMNQIKCWDPDETTDVDWDDIIICDINGSTTNGYYIYFVFNDIENSN